MILHTQIHKIWYSQTCKCKNMIFINMQIQKYDIHKHANAQIESQIPGSKVVSCRVVWVRTRKPKAWQAWAEFNGSPLCGKKNWTEMMGRKLKKFVEGLVPVPPSSPIESLLWRIEGMEPWPRLHQCIAMCCYIMCGAHPENTMQCIAMHTRTCCSASMFCYALLDCNTILYLITPQLCLMPVHVFTVPIYLRFIGSPLFCLFPLFVLVNL